MDAKRTQMGICLKCGKSRKSVFECAKNKECPCLQGVDVRAKNDAGEVLKALSSQSDRINDTIARIALKEV